MSVLTIVIVGVVAFALFMAVVLWGACALSGQPAPSPQPGGNDGD